MVSYILWFFGLAVTSLVDFFILSVNFLLLFFVDMGVWFLSITKVDIHELLVFWVGDLTCPINYSAG